MQTDDLRSDRGSVFPAGSWTLQKGNLEAMVGVYNTPYHNFAIKTELSNPKGITTAVRYKRDLLTYEFKCTHDSWNGFQCFLTLKTVPVKIDRRSKLTNILVHELENRLMPVKFNTTAIERVRQAHTDLSP